MHWLEEELARSAEAPHRFVVGHHNIRGIKRRRDALARLFREHQITAYLYGHTHRQMGQTAYGGVPALCCPSVAAWNWYRLGVKPKGNAPYPRYPLGYQVNTVYPDKLISEYRYLGGGVDDAFRYVYPAQRYRTPGHMAGDVPRRVRGDSARGKQMGKARRARTQPSSARAPHAPPAASRAATRATTRRSSPRP